MNILITGSNRGIGPRPCHAIRKERLARLRRLPAPRNPRACAFPNVVPIEFDVLDDKAAAALAEKIQRGQIASMSS